MLTALATEPRQDGKHRILAHLGQGGTSDVYLAVAQGPNGFNKLVVLKVLKTSLQNDPEFRAMFLDEARLAARLNHPNIVQTYEVLEENGVSMMVMEYLEGRPLSSLLQRAKEGELTLPIHLRVISDALAGLHYAHGLKDFDGTPLGVVHRDATPHNIFVTFAGQVKVVDFGIAKLNVSSVETRAGMMKGKIRYMPPEQIRCKPVDRRTDVYAAGVMLWQAATGQVLWKDVPETTILARVINGDIPSPRSVKPDVDSTLERICMKAMAPDPDDRYATAAELATELDDYLLDSGSRVSTRDVGGLASELFMDVRESTKMLLEQQLSGPSSLTWTGRRSSDPIQVEPSEVSSLSTQNAPISLTMTRRPQQMRRLAIVVAGGIGFLLSLALIVSVGGRNQPPTSSPKPSSVPTAAAAPSPPAKSEIRLKLAAEPAQAVLFLDGQLAASNPIAVALPRDGQRHFVRASAEGYAEATQQFAAEGDQEVTLRLERLRPGAVLKRRANTPASAPSPVVAKKPQVVVATSARPAPATRSDCDNPFFLDDKGIKRILPQCL